jgi:hypothetical protein
MTSPTILSAPHVNKKYRPNAEKKRGEARRIELLFQMDKRHKELLAAGDKYGLIELAAEYMVLGNHGGCPTKANQVLADADGL